jgi:DNA-binding PadR family transcriptional regulator
MEVDVTWNQLFSCVGPDLLNEADERSLERRINSWLKGEFGSVARGIVVERVEDEGDEVKRFLTTEVLISDEDFGTLIIQLRALGLIAKSDRPRSVKDTKTYWTLTPLGDDHLTLLRAIRREDPRDEAEDEGEKDRDPDPS